MHTHPVESVLQPGDILFTSIPNFLYRRVARATGSQTSHVGIAFFDPKKGWLVAESAVPTVRYSTLANFIARSDNGWLVVRRLRGGLSGDQVQALRKQCDLRMGALYHLGFHFLSKRQFCSKFVYETYLAALGEEIGRLETFENLFNHLPNQPLIFWRIWFMGKIPWQRLTVTPASQIVSAKLDTIWKSPSALS